VHVNGLAEGDAVLLTQHQANAVHCPRRHVAGTPTAGELGGDMLSACSLSTCSGIPPRMSDVTHLLQAASAGDPRAASELLPLVYAELRRLAAYQMAKERPGQTLQPTALVHEAWLRIAGSDAKVWEGRRHFFTAAAEAMRRILIDNARRKQAVRHGGGLHRTAFEPEDLPVAGGASEDELLAVDEALEALAAHDPRKAELVKLRYFAGLTIEETAAALDLSERTAKRDWAYARAWLHREIARRHA
jgi:RNA polymerase sigma factor (TIGR02999 family)